MQGNLQGRYLVLWIGAGVLWVGQTKYGSTFGVMDNQRVPSTS